MCIGNHGPRLSPLLPGSSPNMAADQSLRIPKNKSTSNLLSMPRDDGSFAQRTRFSFDSGTSDEMNNLKRCSR